MVLLNKDASPVGRASKTISFLAVSLLTLFALITLFLLAVDWPDNVSLVQKLINHNRFIADALLLGALIVLFFSKHGWLRVISYLLFALGSTIFLLQFFSFLSTRAFVPLVAVENIALFDMVGYVELKLAFITWMLLLFGCIYSFERSNRGFLSLKYRISVCLILIVLAGLVLNDRKFISEEMRGDRYAHFRSSLVYYPHKSPVGEFADTFKTLYQQSQASKALANSGNALSAAEQNFATKHGIAWAEVSADYPLIKREKLSSPEGIVLKPNSELNKPNLIVFFVEGMSARLIQPYSEKFPKISPNIQRFASDSMVVEHHFNHTYATYRGLVGGHCSIFPFIATIEGHQYRCFPHVLQDEGYATRFYYSQIRDKSYIDELLVQVGIQDVQAFDELVDKVASANGRTQGDSYPHKALTDIDLMKVFINDLKSQESNMGKPFYLGMYNIETHTKSQPREFLAKYPKTVEPKSQYILDSVHNFDAVFGLFWDYFKSSAYADNTIVILTSDHARFPEEDYMSMWDYRDSYSPVFSDRIPLIIYSPFHKIAEGHKFKVSSSLDLAPSILHLAGINEFSSPFLGQSMFKRSNRMLPMAIGGTRLHYTTGGVMELLQESQPNQNLHLMHEIIKRSREVERADRMWREEFR